MDRLLRPTGRRERLLPWRSLLRWWWPSQRAVAAVGVQSQYPFDRGCAPVARHHVVFAPCSLKGKQSLIEKLRKRADRDAPALQGAASLQDISSALPPGSSAPELRARVHQLLKDRPDLLTAVCSAADLEYLPMTEEDAQDLADLQAELFPAASYPGGAARCAEMLSEPGMVALKACFRGDDTGAIAGIFMSAGNRAAIEACAPENTVSTLREQLTIPRMIPFDSQECTELAYIISVGVVAELRRRGVAQELLSRGVAELQRRATSQPGGTGLRAVALDLVDYNSAAMRCYEAFGFRRIHETPEVYAGVGRRTHSSFLYVWTPPDDS